MRLLSWELLHSYGVIRTFPALLGRPIKREHNLLADNQFFRRQIDRIHARTAIATAGIVAGFPAVITPVHHAGCEQNDPQLLTAGKGARLVVEAPPEKVCFLLLENVSLHGL